MGSKRLSKTDWVFFVLQLLAMLLAYVWWSALPSPGYAIGVLAVLAAVMSIHTEMPPFQKALWLLLIGVFLVIELRAIDWDRANNDVREALVRMQERDQFATILRQGEEESKKTLDKMSGVTQLARRSIYEETGGDSYVVVRPDFTPTGKNVFTLGVGLCAKCLYSVPNAYVYFKTGGSQTLILHDTVTPMFVVTTQETITPAETGETTYGINVTARNKPTQETLKVRFNAQSKQWECSWHIERVEKLPHFNPKTRMAEGEVLKVLEDSPWQSNSITPLNPLKTTVVH